MHQSHPVSFTLRDYLTWPEDERWELIDGVPCPLTPACCMSHQRTTENAFALFRSFLVGGPGSEYRVFAAPLDLVFDDLNVVQPDVFVVGERVSLSEDRVVGVPDLVVEVVSPSTELKDRREKKDIYRRFGVPVYILIDAQRRSLELFLATESGDYAPGMVLEEGEYLFLSDYGVRIPVADFFGSGRFAERAAQAMSSRRPG